MIHSLTHPFTHSSCVRTFPQSRYLHLHPASSNNNKTAHRIASPRVASCVEVNGELRLTGASWPFRIGRVNIPTRILNSDCAARTLPCEWMAPSCGGCGERKPARLRLRFDSIPRRPTQTHSIMLLVNARIEEVREVPVLSGAVA